METAGCLFEYHSAADPKGFVSRVPYKAVDASAYGDGPSRVVPVDNSKELGLKHPASSPNLTASFVRIVAGETLTTSATATSQAFYAVQGSGQSTWVSKGGLDKELAWGEGDLFTVPLDVDVTHRAAAAEPGGEGNAFAALYWVHDEPLLRYLGVRPMAPRFEAAVYRRAALRAAVDRIRHEPGAAHRNRLGVLLGNQATSETKTLTHVCWALLNVIPAGDVQPPHRHNSVALDLAVSAKPGVYTLMAEKLDADGNLAQPIIRADWKAGSMFVTPPGWWHSHHNESDEDAWVLPCQDAGLLTHMRTLDIQFAPRPAPAQAAGGGETGD